MGDADELTFTVEVWDDRSTSPERILARCARMDVAIAAYEKVVDVFPNRVVLLRDGSQVVLSHKIRRKAP